MADLKAVGDLCISDEENSYDKSLRYGFTLKRMTIQPFMYFKRMIKMTKLPWSFRETVDNREN